MKHLYLLLLSLLGLGSLAAQPGLDYYWVGTASNGVQGSGDWTDINAWRIGSVTGTIPTQVPISNNNVYFTAAAFPTALSGTTPVEITVSNSVNCDTFYWDPAVPTLSEKILFQTTTPGSTGPVNINLDIYGTFNLPDSAKIDFDFNGSLRFRSIDALSTIETNGNKLLVKEVVFEGSDTTEFRFLDFFYVDDPREYHYSRSLTIDGGFCQFVNGYVNFNGQDAVLDRFRATANNNPTRRLNIAGSHIRLIGHGDAVWSVNFNTAGTNYASFDATGSHLLVSEPNRLGYAQQLWLGSVAYDSITIDARYYTLIRRYDPTINHLFANTDTRFYENMNLTVNNLHLRSGHTYSFHANNGRPKLILDQVFITGQCHEYVMLRGWGGTMGHIGTQVPGATLTLDKVILNRVEGDISTGSSYVANNSVDAGGNLNWTINAGTGRTMRFQYSNASINRHRWHNLNNWQEWNGTAWVPATCLPTPDDHVSFDGASFPATGTQYMRIDSVAYCHDMRWDTSVSSRIWMEPYLYTDRTVRELNIFGTLELAPNMNISCYNRPINFWGADPDSIISNGVFVGNSFNIMPHADYQVIGDLGAYHLYGFQQSSIRSKNNQLNLGRFYVYHRFLDSVEVNITGDNAYCFRDLGGFQLATAYTGNTTFYFWGNNRYNNCNNNANNNNRVYLYGSSCTSCPGDLPPMHLPNTVFRGELYGLVFHMTVHGDLSFDRGARFHHWNGTSSYFTQIRVLGDQPNGNYNGDMNLAPSESYVFDSYFSNWYPATSTNAQYNSIVEVVGSLNGTGTCQAPLVIRTLTGNPMTWQLNQTNISFAFVEGLENIGPTATFNNSIDGTGNSNVVFNTVGTGTTLYWRAHHSNPADFEGDWSDPGHWTTNPASPVGDSACVPSILDTAIMDGMSFSGASNGVSIDDVALCRTLWVRDDVQLLSSNLALPQGHLFINESLLIDVALTQNNYSGQISFIGFGGTIRTSGTVLINNFIDLRSRTATWDLEDAFRLENPHRPRHGLLQLISGTLRTNNHPIDLYNGFVSRGNEPRRLELGSSEVTLHCLGRWIDNNNNYPWFISNGARNIDVDGRNSRIHVLDNISVNNNAVILYMGYDSLALRTTVNNGSYTNFIRYGEVHVDRPTYVSQLYGYVDYRHLHLTGDLSVGHSNLMDSIEFDGGHVYRFNRNTRQHLRSPFGKIISNGSASSFVNLETNPVGDVAYFHKEWGEYFCLDYIKVKDNTATKGINPNTGVADPDLFFYTGTNSDNIGGTARGIWNFSLIFSTHTASAPVVTVCEDQDSADVELYITGNDYYDIRYTWLDQLGNSGADTIQLNDDDNDPTTPFLYSIRIPVLASGYYAFDVATFRCDKRTAPAYDTAWISLQDPSTLVDQPSTASCYLTNKGTWVDFFDDIDAEPVLSLQDSTNGGDSDSLQLTNVNVFFEPTVQYYAGRPYLERHWRITPDNNVGAKVRLYFTQQELDSLYRHTFHYRNNLPFGAGPAYLEVWKFDAVPHTAATIGSSAPTVVPHTVVPLTGAAAKAFTTTTDVYAIEFEVSSFSHFILVPTEPVLLSNDLLSFEAAATPDQQVNLTWTLDRVDDLDHFEVLHSLDGIHFEAFDQVAAGTWLVYDTKHPNPQGGDNYYRLRLHHKNGSSSYSPIRTVYLDKTHVVRVYPNPVQAALTIEVEAREEGPLVLEWVNPLGQLVYRETHSLQQGRNRVTGSTASLSKGVYLLQLYQNGVRIGQQRIYRDE